MTETFFFLAVLFTLNLSSISSKTRLENSRVAGPGAGLRRAAAPTALDFCAFPGGMDHLVIAGKLRTATSGCIRDNHGDDPAIYHP